MLVRDKVVLAGVGASIVLLSIAAWLLIGTAFAGPAAGPTGDAVALGDGRSPGETASAEPSPAGMLVVDLEGGVAEPGIQEIPDGSRIADAIVAAGGYSADADVSAAARQLNLAALVSDGQQIYVPRVGDTSGGGSGGGTGGAGGSAGGLLNLNQATAEQLDALPGIGPVTVQKIVAARQEQPFRSLDELVERKVLTTAQLAKIRDQVTV